MSLVSHIPPVASSSAVQRTDTSSHASSSGSSSGVVGKISDIPPYDPSKPKRSKDWTPLPIDVSEAEKCFFFDYQACIAEYRVPPYNWSQWRR